MERERTDSTKFSCRHKQVTQFPKCLWFDSNYNDVYCRAYAYNLIDVPYYQLTEEGKTRALLTGDSECCAEHCSAQIHPEVFVLSEVLSC